MQSKKNRTKPPGPFSYSKYGSGAKMILKRFQSEHSPFLKMNHWKSKV
ncbi:hypothetical protein [Bacillus cereus]|nr:hypothetical protein [Bacillus cereus]